MSDVLTREEFIRHLRYLEEAIDRGTAMTFTRDELLQWVRNEITARIMAVEMNISGTELTELINSTPIP